MGWGEGPWPGTEGMGDHYVTGYCPACGRSGGSVRRGEPAEYCRTCLERRGVEIVHLDSAAEAWQVGRAREGADIVVGDYAVWMVPRPRRGVSRAADTGLPVVFVAVPVAVQVHCQCGKATGERCAWTGPVTETVVVEWMPLHLRASHEAAGNSGTYPHNGAVRMRCDKRSCAWRLVADDPEWATVVEDGETRRNP